MRSEFSYVRSKFSCVRSKFSHVRKTFSYVRSMFSYVRSTFSCVRSKFSHVRPTFSYVRSKFSCVRSSHGLCASAHSLEGTLLVTRHRHHHHPFPPNNTLRLSVMFLLPIAHSFSSISFSFPSSFHFRSSLLTIFFAYSFIHTLAYLDLFLIFVLRHLLLLRKAKNSKHKDRTQQKPLTSLHASSAQSQTSLEEQSGHAMAGVLINGLLLCRTDGRSDQYKWSLSNQVHGGGIKLVRSLVRDRFFRRIRYRFVCAAFREKVVTE